MPKPPTTWGQMIDVAEKLASEGKPATIQVQANKYEGFTVWANALIESAGGQILSGPETVDLPEEPTDEALGVMGRLAASPAAATNISTSTEDTARLGFESGDSAFMVNYTFAYGSALENAPDVAKNMGFAKYPKVAPNLPSKPPLGGFNLGVGAYSNNPDLAFQAAACLSNPKSELTATELDGLPPSRSNLYTNKVVKKAYPGIRPAGQALDRVGWPAPAHSRLSGRQPGDSGLDPAPGQDRPQRREPRLRRAARQTSRTPSSGRACCEGGGLVEAATAGRPAGGATKRTRSERRLGWMLCAPAVIAMLLVTAYPIRYAIVLSLQNLDLRFPDETSWAGLTNYQTVLTSSLWWQDVLNTVIITVFSVAIELTLGMLIALVMYRAIFGRERSAPPS